MSNMLGVFRKLLVNIYCNVWCAVRKKEGRIGGTRRSQ